MPTIAVIDDDSDVLTLVKDVLEWEGYHVVEYPNGPMALDGFHIRSPDLAIIDIRMPQMDGIELLRRLRTKSEVPVIFLTAKLDEIDELFGLQLGADDFIRKPFSQRVLIERVKAVLRRARLPEPDRERNVGTKILERGELRMDQERHTCTWKGRDVRLTVTEYLLLETLANRPGVIKTRDALRDAAYPDQSLVDERRIDGHIKRLRGKFRAVDKDFDGIETLHSAGYCFKESGNPETP